MKRFISERYKNITPSSMMRMAALDSSVEGAIDLTLGEPDIPTPEAICESLAQSANRGETHYAPGMGLADLRKAVSDYWKRKYGLMYGADEIFVTVGGSQASSLVFQVTLERGDEVIIPEPFFTFYEQQVLQAGGVPIYCMSTFEEGFVPNPKRLESLITPNTKAVIINSPCNPTGAVFPKNVLLEIASAVKRHDLLVISDELYEGFSYFVPHTPFASLPDMKERTVTIGGLSKSYAMTGWRIGYAMADSALLKTMQNVAVVQTLSVNTMVQKAAEYALNNCDCEAERISAIFRNRVTRGYEFFSKLPGIKCSRPGGSFYLFLDVTDTGMSGEDFAVKMLKEAKVVTIPGDSFGPHCGNYVRIACTVSEELMEEASKRIRRVLS